MPDHVPPNYIRGVYVANSRDLAAFNATGISLSPRCSRKGAQEISFLAKPPFGKVIAETVVAVYVDLQMVMAFGLRH